MASDDILGYCYIDWRVCVEKPGEWAVNNLYELEGDLSIREKDKKILETLGFIYI